MSFAGASKFNPSGIEPQPSWWIIEHSNETVPLGYIVVDVIGKASAWIESQPVSEWKYGTDFQHNTFVTRYIISKQLFTLLTLKWTK